MIKGHMEYSYKMYIKVLCEKYLGLCVYLNAYDF